MKDALETEKRISKDLASFLREYLPQAGKSYDLDPVLFPKLHGVRQVTLTPQCIFFLTYQDGSKVARTLENLSPESMMKVLEKILPVMTSHFKEKREEIAVRSIELYRIAAELKEISADSATSTSEKASPYQTQKS